MRCSHNDVIITNYLVSYLVVLLGVGSPGESIDFALVLALDELDPVV